MPLVAASYNQLLQRGKALKLVFVSLDKDERSFDEMRSAMPWPALPFGGTRAALLAEAFSVEAIPSLVLLRADGTLISTDGIRLMRKHTRGQHTAGPHHDAPLATPHITRTTPRRT